MLVSSWARILSTSYLSDWWGVIKKLFNKFCLGLGENLTISEMVLTIFLLLSIFIICIWVFAYLICVNCVVCLVPAESRRGCHISWNQSYQQLWAAKNQIWVLYGSSKYSYGWAISPAQVCCSLYIFMKRGILNIGDYKSKNIDQFWEMLIFYIPLVKYSAKI